MAAPRSAVAVSSLLEAYASLQAVLPHDERTLAEFLEQRQKIIDRLREFDGSKGALREVVDAAPELRDLVRRISTRDQHVLDWARAHHDELRRQIEQTRKGTTAAKGYRLRVPTAPAIIDRQG